MKLNLLISSIFLIPSLAVTTSRHLREGESGRSTHGGGDSGGNGGGGGDRNKDSSDTHGGGDSGGNGGGGGDRNKDSSDDRGHPDREEPNLVTITGCDASLECNLHSGQVGTFVCRSWTHPVLGDTQYRPLCIPNDRAWSTDVCGCCLDEESGSELECPSRPEFINLDCANSTQPDAATGDDGLDSQVERAADREFHDQAQDRQFICRDLINPFTGAEQATTLLVPIDHAVTGDTCGCCETTGCPELDESRRRPDLFTRPDFIEKSCAFEDEANNIACDLRPSGREEQGNETSTQGFFVCREMFDPRGSGGSRKEAVCISETRAWETDECGCCDGQDCPVNPPTVDIDCSMNTTNVDHSCDLQSGEKGVFVCRTIFNPFDGQAHERGFCIPVSRGWVTDVCGCCENSCPTSPTDGFDTEAAQLEGLALEVPDNYGIDSSTAALTEGSSTAMTSKPATSSVFFSAALIITAFGTFSL